MPIQLPIVKKKTEMITESIIFDLHFAINDIDIINKVHR